MPLLNVFFTHFLEKSKRSFKFESERKERCTRGIVYVKHQAGIRSMLALQLQPRGKIKNRNENEKNKGNH